MLCLPRQTRAGCAHATLCTLVSPLTNTCLHGERDLSSMKRHAHANLTVCALGLLTTTRCGPSHPCQVDHALTPSRGPCWPSLPLSDHCTNPHLCRTLRVCRYSGTQASSKALSLGTAPSFRIPCAILCSGMSEKFTAHKLCRPAGLVCCWMMCLEQRDTPTRLSLLPTRPCPGQSSQSCCVQAWPPHRSPLNILEAKRPLLTPFHCHTTRPCRARALPRAMFDTSPEPS